MWDLILTNLRLATMAPGATEPVESAAIGIAGDRLAFVGPMHTLPGDPETLAKTVVDGWGTLATPGLIDCHTHLVFAGNRAREYEMRLQGVSYAAIARAGGGIRSTVRATRAASLDELVAHAQPRLSHAMAEGVTTVEIKSGYGLTLDAELAMLQAARVLGDTEGIDVVTTCLAAHTIPAEHADDPETYVDTIVEEILPIVAARKLADAVDAYQEHLAFSAPQVGRVFERAKELGLPVKLHADQFSDTGAAALAARYGALSADHLEHTTDAGVAALAEAGTTAVLLPGAYYTLRETKKPPIDALRRAGVPIAVATDANPGSSPIGSPLLAMNMACTLFGLTPAEALVGATRTAARALGLAADRGSLEVGKRADIVLWEVEHPAELIYWQGGARRRTTVKDGKLLS